MCPLDLSDVAGQTVAHHVKHVRCVREMLLTCRMYIRLLEPLQLLLLQSCIPQHLAGEHVGVLCQRLAGQRLRGHHAAQDDGRHACKRTGLLIEGFDVVSDVRRSSLHLTKCLK